MSHQRNPWLDNAIDAVNRATANLAAGSVNMATANLAVAVAEIERVQRLSTSVPPLPPDGPEAEPPVELRDEDTRFTSGIPSRVFNDMKRGGCPDPYQAAKPVALSSRMMPEKSGLYWVYDEAAPIKAAIFRPWNGLLFISRDGDGPDRSVRLYRICMYTGSPVSFLIPVECFPGGLMYGPRMDPPQLVLEEPESEAP